VENCIETYKGMGIMNLLSDIQILTVLAKNDEEHKARLRIALDELERRGE